MHQLAIGWRAAFGVKWIPKIARLSTILVLYWYMLMRHLILDLISWYMIFHLWPSSLRPVSPTPMSRTWPRHRTRLWSPFIALCNSKWHRQRTEEVAPPATLLRSLIPVLWELATLCSLATSHPWKKGLLNDSGDIKQTFFNHLASRH
jgi:hypothetical protein